MIPITMTIATMRDKNFLFIVDISFLFRISKNERVCRAELYWQRSIKKQLLLPLFYHCLDKKNSSIIHLGRK